MDDPFGGSYIREMLRIQREAESVRRLLGPFDSESIHLAREASRIYEEQKYVRALSSLDLWGERDAHIAALLSQSASAERLTAIAETTERVKREITSIPSFRHLDEVLQGNREVHLLGRRLSELLPSTTLPDSILTAYSAAEEFRIASATSLLGSFSTLHETSLRTIELSAGIQRWMEVGEITRRPELLIGLQRVTRRTDALWVVLSDDPSGFDSLSPALVEFPIRSTFELTRATGIALTEEEEYLEAEAPTSLLAIESMDLPGRLGHIDPAFRSMFLGAHKTFQFGGEDHVRQSLASIRELIRHVLERLAPEESVVRWRDQPTDRINGELKREVRLAFIFRHLASGGDFSKMVDARIKAIASHYKILNTEVHRRSSELDRQQVLSLIRIAEYTLIEILSATDDSH